MPNYNSNNFRIYLSVIDLNAWKILGSKAVLGGKCDKKSFFACNNYMFNFVLENNNLYRLDAYDLSRDFREVSGDGFSDDASWWWLHHQNSRGNRRSNVYQ